MPGESCLELNHKTEIISRENLLTTRKVDNSDNKKSLALSLGSRRSIDCHEDDERDNVHPILGQEAPVVGHLPLLLPPLLLLQLLYEGRGVGNRSSLHP